MRRVGWRGRASILLSESPEAIADVIGKEYPAHGLQRAAWTSSIGHLREAFADVQTRRPEVAGWQVLFEYELPREGGRRPDVCVLTGSNLLVIEYKGMQREPVSALEQCRGYVRDLREYHQESRRLAVEGVVLVAGRGPPPFDDGDCIALGPTDLGRLLERLPGSGLSDEGVARWVDSEYVPLPSLFAAAQIAFKQTTFPLNRRAVAAGLDATVRRLREFANESALDGFNRLVIVAGRPGTGKTLAGLRLVFEHSATDPEHERAAFLSGNGPLVTVLRDMLGKVHVENVHAFTKEYARGGRPPERILVFDEAQRAWNLRRMQGRTGPRVGLSEPELFVDIASRTPGSVVIALVGEGQEINDGEDAGIGEWLRAASSASGWRIEAPPGVGEGSHVRHWDELGLVTGIRAHCAATVHEWVEDFLHCDFAAAAEKAEQLRRDDFFLYVSDDLDACREFLRSFGSDEKLYGLLASSQATNLEPFGFSNEKGSRSTLHSSSSGLARWYNGKKHPPRCRALDVAATEFASQGLELDATCLLWGNDLLWDGSAWRTSARVRKTEIYRWQVYRVLLTRARDGMMIFVPGTPELRQTRVALESAGARALLGTAARVNSDSPST